MNSPEEKARMKKVVEDLIILKARTEKKTPLEVIREMKAQLEERKLARKN